ncbi:TonB-dependent receptor SusC, partial [termite gut metagenome]
DYQEGKTNVAAHVFPNNPNLYDDGFDPRGIYNGATDVGGIDNRDYYKELIRDQAFSQEHNISLSGGNDKVNYYTSLGLLDQSGLMVYNQDTYQRYSVTGKVSYAVNEWITATYSHRFVRDNYDRPSQMTDDLFKTIGRQCWPVLPLNDGNGNLFEWRAVELRDGGNDKATTDNSYQQIQLTFEPVKDWKIFADANYSIKNYNRHWDKLPLYHYDVNNEPYVYSEQAGGNVHEEYQKDNLFGLNLYTEYSLTVKEKNNFKVMIGFQEQQMSQLKFGLQRNGIIYPSLPEVDLTNGLDFKGNPV